MNMHVGASKFKVGDRVVEDKSADCCNDLVEHWNEYWKSSGPFDGAFYITGNVGRDSVTYSNRPGGGGPQCPSRYLKPAPLFAVGDKVRVATMEWGKEQHGKTGTVTRNNLETSYFSDLDVTIEYDVPLGTLKTNSYRSSELELIPAYTSCAAAEVDNLADEYGGGRKFEIGDRVNWTRVRGKFDGSTIDAIDSSGTWPVTIRATSGEHTYAALSELEHVAVAPATATTPTIRAGAYYKTRDGRKVGPMEVHRGSYENEHPWSGSLDREYNGGRHSFIFKQDGRNYEYTALDLIADWPAVATQQPTTIADIVRKHSGTAIVCLIENGQPKPSTLPFVHLNKEAAATEAARLAGIHKGQEFGVYACVDVRKVERVYEHEWQRLAARGSKIPAMKALRDLAGIDLAAAKSGVDQFLVRAA